MSLVPGLSFFQPATYEVTAALAPPPLNEESGNHSASGVVVVVPKHPAYVLGEQLRNLCSYIYSMLPTFSLPRAQAKTSSSPCVAPVGSYEEGCHKPKITYSPEEGVCKLTTRCATIFEGLPHKANEITFKPGQNLVLENVNGTLVDQFISPEKANKKLTEYSQAIKAIDEKLEDPLGEKERNKLEAEKEQLLEQQKTVIGKLSAGDIVTFDKDNQIIVVTPENRGRYDYLYDIEAFIGFKQLASSTGGVMGLSPSATLLSQIIEKTFAHILYSAKPDEPFDIAFVLDTTHSMADDIDAVKKNLIVFLENLRKKQSDGATIRIALLEYRDRYDIFLNRVDIDFTSDLEKLEDNLKDIAVSGGGDHPEAVLDALFSAQKDLSWNSEAKRAVILIGDAPPHDRTIDNKCDREDLIQLFSDKDIKIAVYPIITSAYRW